MITVKLSNGIRIEATINHKWYVEKDGIKEVVETKDLKPGYKIQEFELPKYYEEEKKCKE